MENIVFGHIQKQNKKTTMISSRAYQLTNETKPPTI